jgi:hypothetical protein
VPATVPQLPNDAVPEVRPGDLAAAPGATEDPVTLLALVLDRMRAQLVES